MVTAIKRMSALRTCDPKIVRSMRPICRAKPKWAISPSAAVPEFSVAGFISVQSVHSKRGADHVRWGTKHGHRVLVEARGGAAVHHHAAQRGVQRRAQYY